MLAATVTALMLRLRAQAYLRTYVQSFMVLYRFPDSLLQHMTTQPRITTELQ